MSKYTLNEEKLRARYKQIVAFHYVSCVEMTGIADLVEELVSVTLAQKYMGEAIPVGVYPFLFVYNTIIASGT